MAKGSRTRVRARSFECLFITIKPVQCSFLESHITPNQIISSE